MNTTNGFLYVILLLFLSCGNSEVGADIKNTAVLSPKPVQEQQQPEELSFIRLPEGFRISVFAKVPNARSMCLGERGTVFVGNRSENSVYAVVDMNSDGVADKVYKIIDGLNMPNGVAFKDGSLYVAEVSRILRFDSIETKLNQPPKPVVVYDKYPTNKHHGWKYIAFGPDGLLYVPVGAPCNVCNEKEEVFATITTLDIATKSRKIFASGIRNTVGFDWHPVTGDLWFTDNGRDMMGDDIPNDELNYAPEAGMHFGFPFCHQGNVPDPEFGKGKRCADYVSPKAFLGPHVAALGMKFYTGNQFPARYKHQIFIAEHGSWNRSKPIGYRVGIAFLEGDRVVKYEPFAEGWLQNDNVKGRPVDILNLADGSILVSDDYAGLIYKIQYNGAN